MINYDTLKPEVKTALDVYAGFAYSSVQGVHHTYLLASYLNDKEIGGAFVECGVAASAMVCAMAEACRQDKVRREFHLFDSFCGIPMAGPEDHDQPGIGPFVVPQSLPIEERLVSSGISSQSVRDVQGKLNAAGFPTSWFLFHEGWFQHTLPICPKMNIAFLRLDGDLYESTKVCLEWLYDMVVPGGIIVIDDYPLAGSRKAFDEFVAARGLMLDLLFICDTGAVTFTKPCA